MDNSFNFTKKNKVQIKNPMLTDRHKGPKGITPSNSSKDEDAISLDLSEWSVEQFWFLYYIIFYAPNVSFKKQSVVSPQQPES